MNFFDFLVGALVFSSIFCYVVFVWFPKRMQIYFKQQEYGLLGELKAYDYFKPAWDPEGERTFYVDPRNFQKGTAIVRVIESGSKNLDTYELLASFPIKKAFSLT